MANVNVDELLLRVRNTLKSKEEEAGAEKALRREKNEARQEDARVGIADVFTRTGGDTSAVEAVKSGLQLGFDLRHQIDATNFDAGTFYTVLLISIIKDILDCLSLGVGGTIFNIAVTVALMIIFFMRGSWFKRYLVKRFLWPIIISVFIEFIPFVDFFPTYSLMAIFLKLKMDKERKQLGQQLEEVEKDLKKIAPRAEYERYLEENQE
jgi:hypothetical protein